jgi:hypothetical protein
MKRRLSSIIVPFFKYIPVLLLANVLFWVVSDFRNIKLSALLANFFICAVFYLLTFGWKSVSLKGDTLYVFNYLKRIEISTSNIENVEALIWWHSSPRTIILTLKSPCEFGDKIVFVPKPLGYMATDTADDLRRLLISRD